ncbi:MAG: hypothetical protein J6Y43_03205, partial [Clostridia bacterium]|nr:hypothetical protein [Clostridia bacterium]
MKLLNCYISSFGNLKDFSYEFDGKLNTVKEENGWGKSTFASFIKSMFYGLDDAKRTVEDNERKRFTPWNSTDKFGGSLTFEWGGKPYKVERFFGAKTSDDTVKLYDINSGKTYTEGAAVENLGKRIFSIDEEGFLSTTYFSQKDFEIKSNSSITSKFNEVSEISDAYAFDRAIRTLDDKIKELKARGDNGRIADLKRQISAVNDEEERIKRSVQALDGLKKDFETLESESAVLDENIKDLTVKLQAAGKREAVSERKRRYDTVNAELIDLKSQVAAAEKTLNGKPLLKEQISDCEKCLRDLYEISAKSAALKDDIADIKGEYSPKKAGKPFTGKGSRLLITVQIISVLFILAGILITVGGFMWGLAFLGSGVIFGVLSVIKRDNRELAELYGRKERELAELEESKIRLTEG